MKSGYTANFKNCVTCDYWTGPRSLNSTRTRAEYDSGVDGNCLEGGRKITHKPPSATCSKWQKWGQLRSLTNSARTESKKKGVIPYPIFVALILLVALIRFIAENGKVFLVIGIIFIICLAIGFFIYRKNKKNRQ
jgi:hypothetical protein